MKYMKEDNDDSLTGMKVRITPWLKTSSFINRDIEEKRLLSSFWLELKVKRKRLFEMKSISTDINPLNPC